MFLKIIFRIFVALAIGALAGLLFLSVLPAADAYALSIVIAAVDLVGMLATAQSGPGTGIRFMLWLGEVLLSFPAAAWALTLLHVPDRGVRIGLAAAIACAIGMLASRHGYGRESARLVTIIIAVSIPLYAILAALVSGDGTAVVAACVATAVAPVTAAFAHVWPDAHHERLYRASAVCVLAGLAVIVRLTLFGG